MKQLSVSYSESEKIYIAGPTTAGASGVSVQATFAKAESVFAAIQSSLNTQLGWTYRASATVISDKIQLSAVNIAKGEQVRLIVSKQPLAVVCSYIAGSGSSGSYDDIEELRTAINELKAAEGSSAAQTPAIDSVPEMKDFLEGYNNTDNLKQVIEDQTKVADISDVENMFQ